MVGDAGPDAFVINREIGRGHDAGNHVLDGCLDEGTAVHADLRFFIIDGLEEGKSHEMIPVGMGEKHRVLIASLGDETVSQPPDAGSGIDDDDIVIFCPYLKACGITPVNQI